MSGKDNIVESHGPLYAGEERNKFILEPAGNGRFRLYNPSYQRWLFVSNDKMGPDNVVEAHPYQQESRNEFQLIPVDSGGKRFKIFNPDYKEWMFVSNDKKGPDNIVEAHTSASEDRNIFDLITPAVMSFTLKNVQYDLGAAKVEHIPAQQGEVVLRNDTDVQKKVSATLTQSISEQKFWNTGWPINDGIKVIIQAGHPVPVDGLQLSAVETLESMRQGGISGTYTASYTITSEKKLPAHTEQSAAWRLMVHRIQVPYTAVLVINYGSNAIEFPVSGRYDGLGAPELKVSYKPPVAIPHLVLFQLDPKTVRIER
jgi:hypothetical protein